MSRCQSCGDDFILPPDRWQGEGEAPEWWWKHPHYGECDAFADGKCAECRDCWSPPESAELLAAPPIDTGARQEAHETRWRVVQDFLYDLLEESGVHVKDEYLAKQAQALLAAIPVAATEAEAREKPTIEELEAILEEKNLEVVILPNGEVGTRERPVVHSLEDILIPTATKVPKGEDDGIDVISALVGLAATATGEDERWLLYAVERLRYHAARSSGDHERTGGATIEEAEPVAWGTHDPSPEWDGLSEVALNPSDLDVLKGEVLVPLFDHPPGKPE